MAKRKSEPGITDHDGSHGSPTVDDVPAEAKLEPKPKIEPKPAPEPKAEKKPEPEKPAKPVVPLRVFEALSGVRPTAFAGFKRYAAREEFKPATVTEWRARFAAFMGKPVKSLKR